MSISTEPAIIVSNLHKNFLLPHERSNSLKSRLINFGPNKSEVQHVLKGISFDVKQGEFLGITGRNGSGKSTLLKLLASIYVPTSGSIEVKGRLTPFIELGVGFNPELSGRENLFLNGALLGFNRKDMEAMYDDIVAFAELGEFMDQKLKNYSSGMQVRLAFSIAIRAESEILLIDEVLAVGDVNFQNKCIAVFEEIKRKGTTVVFVSHDMEAVRRFCDRVILMEKGYITKEGNPQDVIDEYMALNVTSAITQGSPFGMDAVSVKDETKLKIIDTIVRDAVLHSTKNLKGDTYHVDVTVKFLEDCRDCLPGVVLRNQSGIRVTASNSEWIGFKMPAFKKGEIKTFRFTFENVLEHGEYFVSSNVVSSATKQFYDWHNDATSFRFAGNAPTGGVFKPNYTVEVVEA